MQALGGAGLLLVAPSLFSCAHNAFTAPVQSLLSASKGHVSPNLAENRKPYWCSPAL